jgi:hypothetical protein
MLPHDKALALSATDTEQLRDLRSRLNRVAAVAPAVAAKSIGPLTRGFYDLCVRVGLEPTAPAAGAGKAWIAQATDQAGMDKLSALVGALVEQQRSDPARWNEVVATGALQAVISRRLALAGREPAKEGVQA